MKITIYTVTDCQFSKQEKEYLTGHNLPFEEKNLEQNKEWLTEMLTVGNNFAGTPVTKISKDDGKEVVLKGFTKEEFDKELGFAPAASDAAPTETPAVPATPDVATAPAVTTPAVEPPAVTVPSVEPVMPAAPVEPAMPPVADAGMPPAPVTPDMPPAVPEPVVPAAPVIPDLNSAPAAQTPAAPDQQLNDILSSLQTKATEPAAPVPPTPVVPDVTPAAPTASDAPPPAGLPNIPKPDFT